ncbi:MAG: hypothetical protein ACKOGP_00260 [Bacteroidota bacterium]
MHLFMLALVGVSLPGLAALMFTNMKFHGGTALEHYTITDYTARNAGGKIRVVYSFASDKFIHPKRFRQVDLTVEQSGFVDAQQMVMETSTGVMGWSNIHQRTLILNGYHMLEVDRPEL